MGKYGPLPAKGTPERREFMRMIGRLGGQATAAKLRGNFRQVLTEIGGKIIDKARQNVAKQGIPADIADAISLAGVYDEGGDVIKMDIIVDVGDPTNPEDRRGRRAARAYEYGSGEHATRGEKEPYEIRARDYSHPMAFLWEYPAPLGFSYKFNPYDEFVFKDVVLHPGVPPFPYLRPAIEECKEELIGKLKNAFREVFIETPTITENIEVDL